MRRGVTLAVVGSLLAHTAALAWVATGAFDREPPVIEQPPAPPPPPAPLTVIEISMLSVPSTGPRATSGTATTSSKLAATSGSVGKPTVDPGRGKPTTTVEPGRSKYMTMRDPKREPLRGVSGDFVAEFLGRSKPVAPPPDIPGERVGNEIGDLRRRMRSGNHSAEQLAAMREQLVALQNERDAEELKPAGGGTYKAEKLTFKATINPDGTVREIEDRNLDSQDKYMKSKGIDPYARNKLAFLDRTRDQRVALGERYRSEQLGKSVVYMQQHIARLWASTTDVAKRKQGLFDLWDECSETGTAEQIAGGQAARAFVFAKIRTMQYTPDEVRALNATRQSKQIFAP